MLVLASLRHDPLTWLRSSPRWHVGHYLEGLVGGFVFATLVTGIGWLIAA